LKKHDYL